ncbi:hypothetical protein C0Q88_08300 [Ralstonia pickettii]|uniref:Uncharacterized protein n=1 Tax=Ralstonia pickettii TaxID=329 RepID=A0A2N4TY90_RALPI|nr:hypothetical protein [Ralstonia pickettii]PLC44669.1 hypothetical protein C0Q88_08300 [Ralstonia pickettii]
MASANGGQITFAYLLNVARPDGAISLLDGYLPILAPILHARQGKLFEPSEISEELRRAYGANVHPYALELLVPPLEKRNWLVKDQHYKVGNAATYRITSEIAVDSPVEQAEVEALEARFFAVVESSFQQLGVPIPPRDVLEAEFVARLQRMPSANAQILERKSNELLRPAAGQGKSTLSLPRDKDADEKLLQESQLTTRLNSAFSEFVRGLRESDPKAFELVGRLTAGALLAEVVLNYQVPANPQGFKGVHFYVDAPLIMDLLDFDSPERHQATKALIDGLRAAGASIRTFDHCVTEVRDNLLAALAAYKDRRAYGNIGQRLMLSTLFLQRATQVSQEVSSHIKACDISVQKVLAGATTFQYFSKDLEQELFSCIGYYNNDAARQRDAASVAGVMRLRAGHIAVRSEFSSARYFLLTRNPRLAGATENLLISRGVHGPEDMPPCMTVSTAAGLLWLSAGQEPIATFSQALLLANCAVIPAAIDSVRSTLEQLALQGGKEELAKTFDAWSRSTRGIEVLNRATLADPTLITKENYHELIATVMESAGEEAARREREKVSAELSEKDAKLDKLQQELGKVAGSAAEATARHKEAEENKRAAEIRADEERKKLQSELDRRNAQIERERRERASRDMRERTEFLEGTIGECDLRHRKRVKYLQICNFAFAVFVAVAGVAIDKYSDLGKSWLAISAIVAGLLLGYVPGLQAERTFASWLAKQRRKDLDVLLSIAKKGLWRDFIDIDERTGAMKLSPTAHSQDVAPLDSDSVGPVLAGD